MADKIVQIKLSKAHEVLTNKLVELEEKGIITFTMKENDKAWDIAAILMEEVEKVSTTIVTIREVK